MRNFINILLILFLSILLCVIYNNNFKYVTKGKNIILYNTAFYKSYNFKSLEYFNKYKHYPYSIDDLLLHTNDDFHSEYLKRFYKVKKNYILFTNQYFYIANKFFTVYTIDHISHFEIYRVITADDYIKIHDPNKNNK